MIPKNGNMICSTDDFTFNTVCRFTCDTGYKLVGSRKRTCLAIAFWTGINTRCRGKRVFEATFLLLKFFATVDTCQFDGLWVYRLSFTCNVCLYTTLNNKILYSYLHFQ